MTPPMTPREKVARVIAAELSRQDDDPEMTPEKVCFIAGDELCWSYIDQGPFDFGQCADAILTALASGPVDHSGGVTDMVDHAELARLAETACGEAWSLNDWRPEGEILVCGGDGSEYGLFATVNDDLPEVAAFIAAANPATVLALLAENAALRGDLAKTERDFSELRDSYDAVSNKLCVERAHGSRETKRATEAERKLAEAERSLELAAIRFDEIYEAADVDDSACRNEATIHGINGLADIARAEIRTFLSKEAERG